MTVSGYLWQAGKFRFFDKAASSADLSPPIASIADNPPSSPPSIESHDGIPVNRFGLTEVFHPSAGCDVDLVFVHGLNGEPKRTWTSKITNVFWPRDLLPSFIEEQKARVLVYGYDADVTSLGAPGVSKDKIHNHAERLIADLFANRRIRKATERPIIFVAHSLGGLVVKRALISSSEISGAKTAHLRSIYISTYGILFLGTPHKGSNVAKWGSYLSTLCQAVVPSRIATTESQLIEALKTNSETLLNIDRQFAQLMDEFHLFFFHEAKPTNLKGSLIFIVDEDSAAPPLPDVERAGIQADHSSMCKFNSENAPGFDLVVDGIQRYSEQAPSIIQDRWVIEKRERLSRAVRKVKENYPAALATLDPQGLLPKSGELSTQVSAHTSVIRSVSPSTNDEDDMMSSTRIMSERSNKPTEPFFIVPPGFRANAFFVGMQKELHELDRRLFDSRRKDGTACVLLHGQPGAGKTHIARHYVFKNRYKFQGGVFWINAHLIDEVYRDFWQIHQRVVAKVSPELVHDSADKLDRNFIDEVRDWFSDREEWLIIFDGVSVEHDRDINELQKFVPDSSNSGIIYISRSRRLETMQRLMRPAAIKISGLKEDDASDLLFKELGVKNPRPAQIRSAKALAKKVGGLPLAVSAIARRLADTHEPIEKFNIKSYSDDPRLGGTYHHIINDLKKNEHTEAINLMNLICFYGPHIPVEMIRLGLEAVTKDGIELEASEEGLHQDINVTFGILMRHALIERNEPDDNDSVISGKYSFTESEPIDVLNLHAVIQKYWCDNLDTNKQLSVWLARAVKLLTTSYQEADMRIRKQPKPGRLSDYRWYLVHARRLRAHTVSYDSKRASLRTIRAEIEGAIRKIEAEIESREPGSSQESLTQTEFQVSIFDRTSISSSSDPSQVGPSLSRLNTDDFESAIADDSPLDGMEYFTAIDQYPARNQFPILYGYPMVKELSTETISGGPSNGLTMGNAKLIERPPTSPTRSDSFRSASAVPLIDRDHAQGLVYAANAFTSQGAVPISWNALAYLSNLTHRNQEPHGDRFTSSEARSRTGRNPERAQHDTLSLINDFEHLNENQEQAHMQAVATQASSELEDHRRNLNLQMTQTGMQAIVASEQLISPFTQRPTSSPVVEAKQSQDVGMNRAMSDLGSIHPNIATLPRGSPFIPQLARPEPSRASRSRASSRTPRAGQKSSAASSGNATPTNGARHSPMSGVPMGSPGQGSNDIGPSISSMERAGQRFHPSVARIRSVSPLPRGPDRASASSATQQSFLLATPEIQPQRLVFVPGNGDTNVQNQLSPVPQQFQAASTSRAPYSDPLPSVSSAQERNLSAPQPSHMHAVAGLGIFDAESTGEFGRSRTRSAQLRADADGQSSHRVSQSPRRGTPSAKGIQTSQLNSLRDLPGMADPTDFAGVPAVSFAPPLPVLSHGPHRRAGSAVEGTGHWKQQPQQQEQYTLNQINDGSAFVDPFSFPPASIINTAQGPFLVPQIRNTGIDGNMPQYYAQRGAPNRNSDPSTIQSRLSPTAAGSLVPDGGTRHRRTLSAPESPGRSIADEQNFWAQ